MCTNVSQGRVEYLFHYITDTSSSIEPGMHLVETRVNKDGYFVVLTYDVAIQVCSYC